jgi:hypothetical protein
MATTPIVECRKRALKMEAHLIALEGAIMSLSGMADDIQGQNGAAIRWQLGQLVKVHCRLSQDNERNLSTSRPSPGELDGMNLG